MDIQELSKYFVYEKETGNIIWAINLKGPAKVGQIAGSKHIKGYVQIGLNGKTYLAHRIAMIMSGYNVNQKDQIDHINGNRSDNRLENLRLATHAENCQNASKRKDNRSGFKGVGFDKRHQKWRARIGANGTQKWIGYFNTLEEAHAAYCKAAKELHGQFAKTSP